MHTTWVLSNVLAGLHDAVVKKILAVDHVKALVTRFKSVR